MIVEGGSRVVPRDLRRYVESTWTYRSVDSESCIERIGADDCTSLVVRVDGSGCAEPLLCGPEPTFRQTPAVVGSTFIGLRLRAGTVAELFGVPGREVAGRSLLLGDLLSARRRSVTERLTDDAGDCFDVVFSFLREQARLARRRPQTERVQAAVRLFSSTSPRTIDRIAHELNTSERTLRRDFIEMVGLRPKLLARVLRFRGAARRLTGARCLASLAFEAGFSDQAHMTREFVALTGFTPGHLQQSPAPLIVTVSAR